MEINGINEHRLWADKERQRRVFASFCVISNALAHVKRSSPELLEQIHDAEVILRFGEVLQDPHRRIGVDSVWRAAIYGVPILIGALLTHAESPLASSFDRQVAALHSYVRSLEAGCVNSENQRDRMLYASMLAGTKWIAGTIARSNQGELKRGITEQAQKHESLGLGDELAMTAASRFEALEREVRRGEPRRSV